MVFFTDAVPKHFLNCQLDKQWLGATPGIIQVLHTWNQELDYHVHMHCIVSGGGLTKTRKIRKSSGKFFIPVYVLRDKFKGKYLSVLQSLYEDRKLCFPLHAVNCKTAITGKNGKINFMKRTGALISKKLSTDLEMPLNILGGTPIRLPFPTAEFFLLQRMK